MATATDLITVEQFEQMSSDLRTELIDGEIVEMSPNGTTHGIIERKIGQALGVFSDESKSGMVMTGDNGYILETNPDVVRCPDVSFVRNARIPKPLPTGFFPGPPDIAVEVLSPSDKASDIAEKIEQWLRAGTIAVWIADPKSKITTIHTLEENKVVGRQVDSFTNEDLLPGFDLSAEKLFELPT